MPKVKIQNVSPGPRHFHVAEKGSRAIELDPGQIYEGEMHADEFKSFQNRMKESADKGLPPDFVVGGDVDAEREIDKYDAMSDEELRANIEAATGKAVKKATSREKLLEQAREVIPE